MSRVDLYLDFSCPWSYLALVRLQDVAERNAASIRLRPVLIESVLATENPELLPSRFAANPAKAAWQRSDLALWAEFWGLRIELGPTWPWPCHRATAAALAAADSPAALKFCLGLYRAGFGAGQDINATGTLEQLAEKAGLDPQGLLAAADAADRNTQLEAVAQELIRRGGFGTPSMFVDEQLYFGNDRIPLVEWTLGPIRNQEFVIPGQHSVW